MPYESFPNFDTEPTIKPERETRPSPKRFTLALESMMKLAAGKIELLGEENLDKIPPGKRPIFACSHISDIDMPAAALELSKRFDIGIANQSVQTFWREPSVAAGRYIAGSNNFFPIDYTGKGSGKYGVFNPRNIADYGKYLKGNKKSALIAAHNPSKHWRLEKGGYGAVLLSQMSDDSVIVPIAIDVQSDAPVGMAEDYAKTMKSKPNVRITIGEPFENPKIDKINRIMEITDKKRGGEKLLKEDIEEFSELGKQLKIQSDGLMRRIAQMVPLEKRGFYGGLSPELKDETK
jgi:1-acyl-sn-glycerol-3-phosphate acyltransferase